MERERGVALIFTLAMLGLLMMLLLAFVGSMSVKKTVSSNAANKRQLDLLVNSAVSRLRLHLEDSEKAGKNLDETVSSTDDSDTLSDGSSPGTAASSAKSSFSKIEFECPEGDETLYDTNLVSGQEDEIEWIYVKDPVSDSYFGRVAYAVIPNVHPILDLKSLGTEIRVGDQYNELNLSDFSNGFKSAGTVSVDKSNILNRDAYAVFYKDNSFDVEHSNFLNIFTTANGLNSEDTYLYRNPKTAGGQYRDSVWRRFDLGNDVLVDYEGTAFYSNSMPSDSRVKALLGSEDDTTMGFDPNRMRYFDNNDKINNPDYRNAYCLPFFKKFEEFPTSEKDNVTFEDPSDWRNQIAANLIDYMLPADSPVTSDQTPETETISEYNTNLSEKITSQASWDLDVSNFGNWPKYTGNKRTLYINEAALVVMLNITRTGGAVNVKVNAIPIVELIDIYNLYDENNSELDNLVKRYFVGMSGKVSMGVSVNGLEEQQIELSVADRYMRPNTYESEGKYFLTTWYDEDKNIFEDEVTIYNVIGDSVNVHLNDIKIELNGVKLLRHEKPSSSVDSNVYIPVDFAKIRTSFEGNESVSLTDGASYDYYILAGAYTNDPRQNLNPCDWVCYDEDGPDIDGNDTQRIGREYEFVKDQFDLTSYTKAITDLNNIDEERITLGVRNNPDYRKTAFNKDDENIDSDDEIAAEFKADLDPDERPISTAFIREAPIRSLWELGFIHRGVKWQTINLKTVQASSDSDVTSFDPSYEKGDAEILDMVCLNYKNSPKFDINAKSTSEAVSANVKKIWKGLLAPTSSNQTLKIGNPGGDTSADEDNKDVLNYGDNEFTLAADYNAEDVFKLIPNDADVEVNDSDYYFFDTDRKSFLRRSAMAPALYKLAMDEDSDIDTDAKQEALIGKVIGLTDAYIYPPEVRVIVVAELLSQQNTTTAIDSVRKLVIMKRTPGGRYILSEILPL